MKRSRKRMGAQTDKPPPSRPASATHRLALEPEFSRRSPFTIDQETVIRFQANRVYQEQFKDRVDQPQAMMGRALANLSQSSVSAVLNGKQTLSPERGELLAKLAGFPSLRDMIGDFGASAIMGDATPPTGVYPNLKTCIDFHGEFTWPPWVIASARAGIFGADDVEPKEWARRLQELSAFIGKFKTTK